MLSYKMDFSSCDIMLGFGKSSHILYDTIKCKFTDFLNFSEILRNKYKIHSRNVQD